jgi:antirestriction protein ArdC
MDRKAVYASVTARIVDQIEAGAGTWRMPWHAIAETGQPVNALTGRPYQGGNHLVLGMVAAANGWSGTWATYKQWQTLGANVRKGEHGTHCVKWSVVQDRKRPDDPDATTLVPYAFTVFSAEQVDGWEAPERPERDTPERIAEAER